MAYNATLTAAFSDHLDKKNVLELDVLETLVTNGANPNVFAHRFGRNVLHMALAAPSIYQTQHIQRILAMGLDPNTKDRKGKTPLEMLLERNNKTLQDYLQIQILLDTGARADEMSLVLFAGARTDEVSLKYYNALAQAIKDNMNDTVLINLITSGVPVVQDAANAFQDYLTAVKYKRRKLSVNVIQAMIIQGADPSTSLRDGDNALHIACRISHIDILPLMGMGIDVNQFNIEGQNPLAVYTGNGGKLKKIVKRFAEASLHPLEQRQIEIAYNITTNILGDDNLGGWKMEQLTRFKGAMIEYIRKQDHDFRKILLTAALNPENPLGKFFRFQRGLCMTIEGRGSLGILADMYCEFDDSGEYAELTSCSLVTGLMRRLGLFKMPVKKMVETSSDSRTFQMLLP